MTNRYPPNSFPCPECGAPAEYETVDIGVGEQQCTPAYCEACGWCQDAGDPDEEARQEHDVVMNAIEGRDDE